MGWFEDLSGKTEAIVISNFHWGFQMKVNRKKLSLAVMQALSAGPRQHVQLVTQREHLEFQYGT